MPVGTEEHHGTLRVFALLSITQAADQKQCGMSPPPAWVVRLVAAAFDGAEVKGIGLLACGVRLTPSKFVAPQPVITRGNNSVSIGAET